jgi:hypothetical protein
MKRIYVLSTILVLSLAVAIALGVDRSPAALAQSPGGSEQPTGGEIQDYPVRQMSYQGKLEINGAPCQGEIDITFKLYTTAFGGTPLWTETQTVTCDKGIFSTRLGKVTPLPYANRFQNLLLLGITPEGLDGELFPRVMLTAAPYAMSLLPGATIVDSDPAADFAYALSVYSYERNPIYANTSIANGVGVTGVAEGSPSGGSYPKGVYGISEAGIGVSGASEDFIGVYGIGWTGVRGDANTLNGFGVYGDAGSYDDAIGVLGSSTGKGAYAVLGQSTGYKSHGVYGTASGIQGSGVYGISMDNTLCPSFRDCQAGVVGKALGAGAQGVFGYSLDQSGVFGSTDSTDVWAATFRNINGVGYPGMGVLGTAKFYGYVEFVGGKSGYVVDVALNAGSVPLERGDVVVVTGMDAPIIGEIPVMRVEKATPETAAGIVGIVDVLYEYDGKSAEDSLQNGPEGRFNTEVTTIQPGQYLGVVTLGAYQWLKVDSSSNPIHAGDLLSISTTPGVAAKAQQITIDGYSFYAPGTIIGKALQDLESGTGTIAVFVSLK